MQELISFITSGGITILAFAVVLGLLVFVHELGHFAIAKWAGIRVQEFGFGYPPRMLTLFRRGGTEYTVNWLPLGGFVKMVGENGEQVDDPGSFASKGKIARAAVLVAGSAMNLLLAVVLFALIAMVVGVQDGPRTGVVEILGVEPNSPATEVGLQPGDEIVSIDGAPVEDRDRLIERVVGSAGSELELELVRDDERLLLEVTPRPLEAGGNPMIGVSISDQRELVRYNPFRALTFGVRRTADFLVLMIEGFGQIVGQLVRGDSDAPPVAGPVGIMQATGEIARTGQLENLLGFAAILSINLAIINMLPFPALDGGRLLFVIIETLRGKRVSPEREGMVHLFGMLLLLGFIAFISIIDIQRLISGGSVLQ